jgi:hypothetical protein
MKLRFIYILAFSLFAIYVLQSKRLGLAAQLGIDRTGSPISNGLNCGSCHSGAFNGVTLTLRVKDSGGSIVTSYIPGDVYTVEFDLFSQSSFTRGFQGVALTSSNTQAGTFSSPQTNTQISTVGTRQYVEHNSPALSAGNFVFIASWTAPVINTGSVTFYSDGVVANGNNGTSGDDPAGPVTLVLTEQASASIDYVQTTYCQASSDPTPTITGISGGTFSSSGGLSLNTTTGEIDLSVSTPGTYTITYTYATGAVTDVVTVAATDDASFSYNSASYCQNSSDPTPTVTGLPGGSFASSPAGLVINNSTGQIDVSASTIGNYSVGYITNGPCATVGTFAISITTIDDASFAYNNSAYCQNGSDPTPTAASSGGSYTSTAGLSINGNSGLIDLSASIAGTYAITYSTSGACSNSSMEFVTINATINANFTYGNSAYCQNGSDPTPTAVSSGGVYTSTTGLSISGNTGQIDVSASTTGTYIVTYSLSGTCPTSSVQTVVINALDNSNFAYNTTTYCQNGVDPTPTVTGLGGGTFTSTGGLSISGNTGQVDVSASTAGTYTVTYTTSGACPSSSVQSLTINATDDASFVYSTSVYCQNGSDPTPTVTGLGGGTFTSTGGLSINGNTGQIDASASTVGTYIVTYATSGACPNSSLQTVVINATDNASFAYNTTAYCQNTADPTPTVTGLGGGTFSSTGGLSINNNTGQVDVSASTPGTYTVTYTTSGACPNSSTQSLTINATDNANFTYSTSIFCQNAIDPTPTVTGLGGGVFSSTSGLSISGNTGQVDVSASTAGTYVITYTTSGSCPNSSVQSLTINATDNSNFAYSSSVYCQNVSDPSPTVTGLGGGGFASTSGLSINGNTGQIDVSASTAGTYTVTYTTSGACPSSSTQSLTINATDNASFTYSTSIYCQNASDPTPTVTGLGGGVFSSTGGLSINGNTGQVDVSASTAGTYIVTYTTSGICPNSSIQTVVINATDNANFTYNASTYCQNTTDPMPTITGLGGGVFSSTSGLSISGNTGQIDVSASTAGTYNVTYTTTGSCPNTNSVSVTIAATDIATFSYNASSACQNGSDLIATVTGLSGGTFASTGGLSINVNTGQIDVSASTVGAYVITYTTNGACPSSVTSSVTIIGTDNAFFTYGGATFCQNAVDPIPTANLSGGTYSVLPAGLVVNSATGIIDVSASAVGTYTITYTTNGPCSNSSTLSVVITATGDASFNYAFSTYCQNTANPSPTITGNPGGVFTSTTGLILNGATGEIDLTASTTGSYVVTYAVTGACPSSNTESVVILAADVAAFAYTDTTICLNIGTNPIINITGANSGIYSSSSSGLVFVSAGTGEIDLAASVSGGYVVTYTSNGACPAVVTVNVDLSICGGVQTIAAKDVYVLFPNPNEGRFSIENKGGAGDLTIKVRDVYGKVIYLQETYLENKEQYGIEVPGIVGGMYLIEIRKEGTLKVLKMIVSE